jgi:hypothetical protein
MLADYFLKMESILLMEDSLDKKSLQEKGE